MALKSTVFKAELQVSDFDRNYYEAHALTLAQHPRKLKSALMVRLLAAPVAPLAGVSPR